MVPANGGVTYSNGVTTYQEVATFTCDPGYDLTGNVTRTCLADGVWGDFSPVCVIKGNNRYRYSFHDGIKIMISLNEYRNADVC